MGMILEFRQPDSVSSAQEASRSDTNDTKGRSAEIIIFPGVRIERHEGSAPAKTRTKTTKRTKRTARRKS